jgi:uncharacterized protein YdhG (YjbR/CyaY superfamily)
MDITPPTTVESYIAATSDETHERLTQIRSLIREQLPEATEAIKYAMPTFVINKHGVVYYAAFKQHVSIFPASDAMIDAIPKLAPHRTGPGTLQFKNKESLPVELIREVVAFLVEHHR